MSSRRRCLIFFNGSPPQSAKGRLVLARALLAQGDTEGASALVRETWRNDPMSADVEKQVLDRNPDLPDPRRPQGAHGEAPVRRR